MDVGKQVRVCEYCKSEFESHACPNCGAPSSNGQLVTKDATEYFDYEPDCFVTKGKARYEYGWIDYRALYTTKE